MYMINQKKKNTGVGVGDPKRTCQRVYLSTFDEKIHYEQLAGSAMICNVALTELQIRGSTEDNSKIMFLFLNKNISCDPSLEPSQRDGSDDGSQNILMKKYE